MSWRASLSWGSLRWDCCTAETDYFYEIQCDSELKMTWIFLLQEYASTVRRIAQSGSMNMKDRLTIELHRKMIYEEPY